jgi:hypothetical protein
MSTSISTHPGSRARAAVPRVAGWRFWLWRPISQGVARSNAQGASIALTQRRVEREDVEDFLAQWADARRSPLPHPV